MMITSFNLGQFYLIVFNYGIKLGFLFYGYLFPVFW